MWAYQAWSRLFTRRRTWTCGKAQKATALAECGVNLTKTPVLQIEFGEGKGKLLLSQLLTDGRLADGYGADGLHGVRRTRLRSSLWLAAEYNHPAPCSG
ncbi:hypothetical protein [Paenibacillus aestuarii]|uniref:Uncharacterized protein n=1 Tax=Paenibacillus aestuarii TaxID=516965 RepID=A0ABW0KF67_9BACL|nr:hypothetical protein [Paenibacillus aestuarii]